MFIYKITSPTGRVYIGQTVDITRRLKQYERRQCTDQRRLYNSILKHGWKSHSFTIIEKCKVKDANIRERFYQEKYNVLSRKGLNCKYTKTQDKSGYLSESTKKRISEGTIGKPKPRSRESIEKMIYTRKKRGLNSHSKETKEKISNTLKGHKVTEETKNKISKSLKGKTNSALSKPVLQFTLSGVHIKTYRSLTEAKRETGILNIIKNIQGIYKQAGGYKWRYLETT